MRLRYDPDVAGRPLHRLCTAPWLIAECFTPGLGYSGSSIGYQLSSVISGGPAPLVATALLAATGSGYAIAVYILFCAIVPIVATSLMPDYTNQDISQEHDKP